MPIHRILVGFVAASMLTAAVPGLALDMTEDVAAGQNVAKTFCGDCHQLGVGARKPRADVPSFPEIANLESTTALSIRVFLQSEHNKMPDYQLARDQTDNVIAFILSLKK
jgi:mono/diheme cytochrome c family protein